MLGKLISGGQTGVDRAALDVGLALGLGVAAASRRTRLSARTVSAWCGVVSVRWCCGLPK